MQLRTFVPAALSFACACAAAQPSVVIFGRVDLAMRKTWGDSTQSGPGGLSARNATQMVSGSRNRWGIRVDDDLGNGWRTHVFLDATLFPADGSTAPTFYDGRSTLGFSHPSYGRVDFGRMDQPALYTSLDFDPWQGDTLGQAGAWSYLRVNPTGAPNPTGLPAAPADFYSFKSNNSINYASPVMAGFQFRLQYAISGTEGTKDSRGFNLTYRNGPFYAGVAHQYWNGNHYATPMGVMYDFGPIKLMAAYATGKRNGNSENNRLIGFTAPLGGGELRGMIERYTLAQGTQHDRKWSVGYFYPLSKRTVVYSNYANARFDNGTTRSGFEAGMKHTF